MGCRNQLLGALDAINKNSKTALPAEKCLLLPSGAETVDDMRESLCYAHFGSYRSFQNEIFALLDARLPQLPAVPRVFITAYNLTESGAADKNADMLCRAVKEYYRRHNLGKIFTVVLISRLHNYKYVDLVNVPKHLLTFYSRIRLLQNKKLRQKTLITVGTVHKFTMAGVLARKAELDEKLKKTPREPVLKQQIAKLRNFTRKSKKSSSASADVSKAAKSFSMSITPKVCSKNASPWCATVTAWLSSTAPARRTTLPIICTKRHCQRLTLFFKTAKHRRQRCRTKSLAHILRQA